MLAPDLNWPRVFKGCLIQYACLPISLFPGAPSVWSLIDSGARSPRNQWGRHCKPVVQLLRRPLDDAAAPSTRRTGREGAVRRQTMNRSTAGCHVNVFVVTFPGFRETFIPAALVFEEGDLRYVVFVRLRSRRIVWGLRCIDGAVKTPCICGSQMRM